MKPYKNRAVKDMEDSLRKVIDYNISEYDICLAELLGCLEAIKFSFCKTVSEDEED